MLGGLPPPAINAPMSSPALILFGPTASGKSALGMALARRLGGEIINTDSMQVYRGAPLATACPSPADYAAVPHHLFEHVEPRDSFNAQRFREEAAPVMQAVAAAQRWPLFVGGTGFYLDALVRGLSPMPAGDEELRRRLGMEYDLFGAAAFHAKLATHDPDSAARIAPGDRQRLIRAREVLKLTGIPLSHHQAQPRSGPVPGFTFHILVLLPPRDWLYRRCEARFESMMRRGAVEEAQALAARQDLTGGEPLLKAVGLADLLRLARGEIDWEEAASAGRRATRHYAKRQWTWARHQIMEADLPGSVLQRIALEEPMEDPDAMAEALMAPLATVGGLSSR